MRISNESIFQKLFGSKIKQRVLKFLYSNHSNSSEREIAKSLRVSNTAINKIMKELLDLNAVECFSVGKAIVWSLNQKSFTYPHIQYFIAILNTSPLDFIRGELGRALNREIAILEGKISINSKSHLILGAFIFGSIAKGSSRADSDVDVLIIIDSDGHKDELEGQLKEIGVNLSDKIGNLVSFHIYSKENFEKNNPHWLKEAAESGIRVF